MSGKIGFWMIYFYHLDKKLKNMTFALLKSKAVTKSSKKKQKLYVNNYKVTNKDWKSKSSQGKLNFRNKWLLTTFHFYQNIRETKSDSKEK